MQNASTASIRPILRDAVQEYDSNLLSQFMALQVLPEFPSNAKNGHVSVLKIENITDESGSGKRAPGGAYSRQESEVDTVEFDCVEYGFEEPVDDSYKNLYKDYFDAEVAATETTVFRLRRAQEVRAAAALFNASTFSAYTGGISTEWSSTSGTPFSDIQDAIPTLKQQVGGSITGEICLAVSDKVFRNIGKTTEIKGLRGGGNGAARKQYQLPLMADELAGILGIDKVFYSAAQNGGSDIWDDEYALLFIRSSSMTLKSNVHLGRTIMWVDDCPENAFIESYRDEKVRSDIIRARQHVDEKLFNVAAGYLLSNITA